MKAERTKKWTIWIAFIFLGISSGSGIYFFLKNAYQKDKSTVKLFSKEEGYFSHLKIHGYSLLESPYLEINIENETIKALIDLGYDGMLSLPSDIIKKLDKKKFIKKTETYGIRGKTYKQDLYEIEEMAIEDNVFFPIQTKEHNLEFMKDAILAGGEDLVESHSGRIGWGLFQACKLNVLVDFKHFTLALCDSLETLKQQGYSVESFVETPLLLDRGSIEFEAMTEKGALRCMLDSGATWNLLNEDLENRCNDHMIVTDKEENLSSSLNPENKDLLAFNLKDSQELSVFKIEGKEFGPFTFNWIKSPLAIDAIFGMESLYHTLVFIDFDNRKIYFFAYPSDEERGEGKKQARMKRPDSNGKYGQIGIIQRNRK